ncbi:MAG: hypothetical protein ACO3CR_02360, partial [Solirubrobacterales bacterium]
LKSSAIGILWASLIYFFFAWLVSPARSAVSVRRFLAVPFGRYPGATFGLLGLFAFLYLLSELGKHQEYIFPIGVVILYGIGAWFFRRSLLTEYPDADLSEIHDFVESVKARSRNLWDKRPRS